MKYFIFFALGLSLDVSKDGVSSTKNTHVCNSEHSERSFAASLESYRAGKALRSQAFDAAKALCSCRKLTKDDLETLFLEITLCNHENYIPEAADILNTHEYARILLKNRVEEMNKKKIWKVSLRVGVLILNELSNWNSWNIVKLRLTSHECVDIIDKLYEAESNQIYDLMVKVTTMQCSVDPNHWKDFFYRFLRNAAEHGEKEYYLGEIGHGITKIQDFLVDKNDVILYLQKNGKITNEETLKDVYLVVSSPKSAVFATGLDIKKLKAGVNLKNTQLFLNSRVCKEAYDVLRPFFRHGFFINSTNKPILDDEKCNFHNGYFVKYIELQIETLKDTIFRYNILHLSKKSLQAALKAIKILQNQQHTKYYFLSKCTGDLTLNDAQKVHCTSGSTLEFLKFEDFLAGEYVVEMGIKSYLKHNRSLSYMQPMFMQEYKTFLNKDSFKGFLTEFSTGYPSLALCLKEESNENAQIAVRFFLQMLEIESCGGDCVEKIALYLKREISIVDGKRCWFERSSLSPTQRCFLKCGSEKSFNIVNLRNSAWFKLCPKY